MSKKSMVGNYRNNELQEQSAITGTFLLENALALHGKTALAATDITEVTTVPAGALITGGYLILDTPANGSSAKFDIGLGTDDNLLGNDVAVTGAANSIIELVGLPVTVKDITRITLKPIAFSAVTQGEFRVVLTFIEKDRYDGAYIEDGN